MAASINGKTAIIIGGGIVGTCCALYLQREGYHCTLIDKNDPGLACSAGNAGNLGEASFVPTALPGFIWRVPKMMLDASSPLQLHYRQLPFQVPWFLRLIATSRSQKVTEIAGSLMTLMSPLLDAYKPLLEVSNAGHFVQKRGRLQVHGSAWKFKGAGFAMNMRREGGIDVQELSGDEARELEPALGPGIHSAYYMPNAYISTQPTRMVQAFAKALMANGGEILRESVRHLEPNSDGGGSVVTDKGRHTADAVVVAAGAWSNRLVKSLGVRVPMIAERGYNTTLPNDGVGLKIPLTAADNYIVFSPMEDGLRISGMAEYAAIETPPNWQLIDRMLGKTEHILPGISQQDRKDWQGPRPSTPDNKPVIDQLKHHPWVFLAFGHGHVGFGTGAITGRIISQLVTGQTPEIDLAPFRHDRRFF